MGDIITFAQFRAMKEEGSCGRARVQRRERAASLLAEVYALLDGLGEDEEQISEIAKECAIVLLEESWHGEGQQLGQWFE